MNIRYEPFMRLALDAAAEFDGQTAPNPPVGAVGIDRNHQILAVAAHERAGEFHAEKKLVEQLRHQGLVPRLHTLIVTLEPCSHFGKTPPCADLLISEKIKTVVYGTRDPNPKVAGNGLKKLQEQGIQVIGPVLESDCKDLIAPFTRQIQTQLPWITLKTAHWNGSMIPPIGQKTFTRAPSLILAHQLRKKSQAIITTLKTLRADHPLFTVRWVPDHPNPSRILAVLSRNEKITQSEITFYTALGFRVQAYTDLQKCIQTLGNQGIQRALIEAGPTLSQTALDQKCVQEHVQITRLDDLDQTFIQRL